jgi:cGMP-specific 3',5'-cyclic phosphodiesterase
MNKLIKKLIGDRVTRDQLKDKFQNLDEHELFTQLISDITNELNVDRLCHKILVNVSILTKSDRGSLFLAKGSRDDRYLVAKLFDVTPDSLLEDALTAAEQYSKIPPLPFGKISLLSKSFFFFFFPSNNLKRL